MGGGGEFPQVLANHSLEEKAISSRNQSQKSMSSYVSYSDESEPSWLEPLRARAEGFSAWLGSACDLFSFGSKSKIGRKQADFFIFVYVNKS